MANEPNEVTDLTEAFYTHAPENFRRILQKQIASHVTKEVDGITEFSSGKADGRFSNSRPSKTIQMSNAHGFHYFIVGASVIGRGEVVAP